MKKIGVLTGGGDCPGLNTVLRAVVKTAVEQHQWEVIGFKNGYRGMVMNEWLRLDPASVSGILDKGGTILGTSNRDNPFHFKVESETGQTEYRDLSDQAVANAHDLGLDCVVVIGGDGTLSSARDFMAKGLKVIGVPKTIDNDLQATDMTFGFMTAVNTATDAIDKLHTTAESHHRIMVLEVMGRYAGWIALYSGIAGGADVILIPEIPFNIDQVVRKIHDRNSEGKHFSIIVVAEGAKPEGGSLTVNQVIADSPDPVRLGGIGGQVASKLEQLTGMETRVTVLGHLQRGGRPSPYDRILATRYGVAAVNLVAEERYGCMVSLVGSGITAVNLAEAVGGLKNVPRQCELIQVAQHIGIEFGE